MYIIMLLKSFTIFLWQWHYFHFLSEHTLRKYFSCKKKCNVIFDAKRPITHFHFSFANAWGHISQHVAKYFYKLALLRTFSVHFSRSVLSNSLWPNELQHPCQVGTEIPTLIGNGEWGITDVLWDLASQTA